MHNKHLPYLGVWVLSQTHKSHKYKYYCLSFAQKIGVLWGSSLWAAAPAVLSVSSRSLVQVQVKRRLYKCGAFTGWRYGAAGAVQRVASLSMCITEVREIRWIQKILKSRLFSPLCVRGRLQERKVWLVGKAEVGASSLFPEFSLLIVFPSPNKLEQPWLLSPFRGKPVQLARPLQKLVLVANDLQWLLNHEG